MRGIPEVHGTYDGELMDTVRPLLSLRALRYLVIRLPSYLGLVGTESDLAMMADAWPDIEELHLNIWTYNYGYGSTSTPRRPDLPYGGSLGGVAHFARKCPRLRVLHLSAMEMVEGALAAVELPREPHDLRRLVIGQVLFPYESADLVARMSEFVRKVFPRVATEFTQDQVSFEEKSYPGEEESVHVRREGGSDSETWGFMKGAAGQCSDCMWHRWRVAW